MSTRTETTTPTTIDLTDAPASDRGPRRTAVLGLLLVAVAPALVITADPSAAPFVAPIIVVGLVGAALAHRFGVWSKVLAVLLGLAAGSNLVSPNGQVALTSPDSFFDFFPIAMLAVGGVLAIVGGVAGTLPRTRTADLGRLRTVGIGLVATAAVVSGLAVATSDDDVDPALLAGATIVEVDEDGFSPADLSLPGGDSVTLAIRNTGRVVHSFTAPSLGVDEVLSPGEVVVVDVTVPVDAAGLQYWCTPHSTEAEDGTRDGMVGTLATP